MMQTQLLLIRIYPSFLADGLGYGLRDERRADRSHPGEIKGHGYTTPDPFPGGEEADPCRSQEHEL